MIDIPVVLSNISTAITLAGGLIGIRDAQKLAAVQADLTERILKTQAHVADLLGVVTEKTMLAAQLQERVRELERQQLERARYELAEVSVGGHLAYRLKPPGALTERTGEPPHFLCQPCFDTRDAKVVLNKGDSFGVPHFHCPVCKTTFC